MSENLYAPPAAAVAELASVRRTEFHVVGGFKMAVLSVATAGLYQIYWFYMHWARYRTWHKASILPAARALFSLLFTHSLAARIDRRLRIEGRSLEWWPRVTATVSVAVGLAGLVLAFVPFAAWWLDAAGVALMVLQTWLLWQFQRAANVACGQPGAESNRGLTWANWIWIALGLLMWLLALVGWMQPTLDVELPRT